MASVAAPVKDRFSSLDTLALARELRQILDARVDKVFDAQPRGLSITFRSASSGRHELLLVPGVYAALLAGPLPHSEELSPFSRDLRRLLAGARLAEVLEPGGERYLELRFTRSDASGGLLLAAELFGVGNIVVARDGLLVAVLRTKRWAHRSVRTGAEYQRPPSRDDPWKASEPALVTALSQSRTDLASTLAARLGYGGPVAEEILARGELTGAQAATTAAPRSAPIILRAVAGILEELGDRPAGFLYTRDGLMVDVEPVASRRWQALGPQAESRRDRFSDAAHEYFASLQPLEASPSTPADASRAELERQRDQQQMAVDGLEATIRGLRTQADAILAHYAEAERQLTAGSATAVDGGVVANLGGEAVTLLVGRPVRESANQLYGEVKRLQGKLAGARSALAGTVSALQAAHVATASGRSSQAGRIAGAPDARRRKAHWFEKYRWFYSSDGVLVIGGRDAATNDLIVRRYLKAADLYVHADIHGAPSVIIKHPTVSSGAISDATISEAAQWGVAFSKAWRAGLASGSAFWVRPDQVSKSGGTGEFVARGAWVIHGTKNYLRDLPTELAIGPTDVEGERLWTVAPPSALRTRGEVRFLLTPGEERERAAVEVSLTRETGLSRDRIQSLLPPGGVTARRV